MSLETSEKRRIAARGWLTRAINRLDSVIHDEESGRIDYEDAIAELNKRIDNLEEVQIEVESYIVDQKDLEADIQLAGEYFDRAAILRTRANKKLSKLILEEDDNNSISSTHSVSHNNTARLPKIELPKFKGDVIHFKEFWDQFNATIHESNLPVITKFTYLKGLLEDEAKATIDGLSLTQDHYHIACKILQERYGRRELIVFSHIQGLLNLKPEEMLKDHLSKLKSLMDKVNIHVRSLETLGIDGSTYGILLTPVILSRLPNDVRMEWAKEGSGKEGDLAFLLEFLQTEIERRERADSFNLDYYDDSGAKEERKLRPRKVKAGTATALHSHEREIEHECGFCKKSNHTTDKCWSGKKMSHEDRKSAFVASNLCFKCSLPGHAARRCRAKCALCGGSHHKWLCIPKNKYNPDKGDEAELKLEKTGQTCNHGNTTSGSNVTLVSRDVSQSVLLQTTKVIVQGQHSDREICVLFDSGSDKTYITTELIKSLKLKPIAHINQRYAVFGGGRSNEEKRSVVRVNMKGSSQMYEVQAVEIPVICAPLERPHIARHKLEKWGIPVSEEGYNGDKIKIDMLIGLDNYWKLMSGNTIRIEGENLVVQESVFGYILSGSLKQKNQYEGSISPQLLVLNDLSELEVKRFWDIEHIGILPAETKQESEVLKTFNDSIEYKNGRYAVGLPWKSERKKDLLSNEDSALQRVKRLDAKLSKDPVLKEEYDKIFKEWEKMNIIEEVPENEDKTTSNPVYYLPHRPVVREDHVTTKVRPVFDASAKSVNGISLNDCLHTGPNMLPDLVEVLIRFRRYKIALNADISKAFLQIELKEEEKDVHRFLWSNGQKIRKMRFCRVTFGVKSSPFLLNATIKYHLNQQPNSKAIEELEENLYMDDWLSGTDETLQASQMYDTAKSVMNKAGMNLTKWRSNEKEILEKDVATPVSVKVLGVRWSSLTDAFQFDGLAVSENVVITKRVVLSVLARIFDPLGFIAPVIMTGKILFQKLWKLGTDWDEEIPKELAKEFRVWIANLEQLKELDIPRRYSQEAWQDVQEEIELHVFADASECGYGSAIYMCTPKKNGGVHTVLVMSKARVSPLKRITLPRLELLACLLAARLLSFVQNAFKRSDVKYTCYSDSKIALDWIKGDPYRFKQFVVNRVQEIQQLTDPQTWKHVPGKENPADLLTRGLKAQVLSTGMWFSGPPFLKGEIIEADQSDSQEISEEEMEYASDVLLSSTSAMENRLLEVERWSSLNKAVKIVELVLRFIKKCKNGRCMVNNTIRDEGVQHDEMGSSAVSDAKWLLIKLDQEMAFPVELKTLKNGSKGISNRSSKLFKLDPFIDKNQVIRIRGRIQNAELGYSMKHPVIIDKGWLGKLIIRDCHERMNHAGVDTMITNIRKQFWIIGLRRMAKAIVHDCIHCQRILAQPCNQNCAPIPQERLLPGLPFNVTGVDYAGPVFVADSPEKLYICLFTCAKTRAIHLELSDSLTTADFLLSFRRFVARRTLPEIMYSDNAKTFKCAKEKLKIYGHCAPDWRFIVPRAPWWGGWWERMVRNVKSALKKCIGSKLVSKNELVTLLIEIENTVNSRPLTQVTDEVDSEKPLTPNDFLGSKSPIYGENLQEIHESRQQLLSMFWKVWSTSYLQNLPKVVPHFKEKGNLKEGSLVLVQEDNVSRLQWPLGQVVETFSSRDGKVRSVKVKTVKGCFVRPVQRLCHLEVISRSDSYLENKEEVKKSVVVKFVEAPVAHIISVSPEFEDGKAILDAAVKDQKTVPDVKARNIVTSKYGRVIAKNPKYVF